MTKLIILYNVPKKDIAFSLHHLQWFMLYGWSMDTSYSQENDCIVVTDAITGDMCHLVNHPKVLKAVHSYGIEVKIAISPDGLEG